MGEEEQTRTRAGAGRRCCRRAQGRGGGRRHKELRTHTAAAVLTALVKEKAAAVPDLKLNREPGAARIVTVAKPCKPVTAPICEPSPVRRRLHCRPPMEDISSREVLGNGAECGGLAVLLWKLLKELGIDTTYILYKGYIYGPAKGVLTRLQMVVPRVPGIPRTREIRAAACEGTYTRAVQMVSMRILRQVMAVYGPRLQSTQYRYLPRALLDSETGLRSTSLLRPWTMRRVRP